MMTIPQMKRHVAELLDARSSLETELEGSRRDTANLDLECDALHREMRNLEGQVQRMNWSEVASIGDDRGTELRSHLAAERQDMRLLETERDAALSRAEAQRHQLSLAVEGARQLSARYRRAEVRRDAARKKLEDALDALGEVHRYLLGSLAGEAAEA